MHNVAILIKSAFNQNYNQYYYKTFLEKMFLSISWKIMTTKFFDNIIMLRFGKAKIAKEKFCGAKKQ